MKKIKGTTWIELDLMTDEHRAQLELDYQVVWVAYAARL